MAKFAGCPGDLTWGKYDFFVTRTQKNALDGIVYMLSGLPQRNDDGFVFAREGFYSQIQSNGTIVIGLHHCSVNVHRNGRITSNELRF